MRRIVVSAVVLGLSVVAPLAAAQDAGGQGTQGQGQDPPGAGDERAPKGSGTTGGYSYDDKPAPRAKKARAVRRHAGPVVSLPGFEQLPDGGSRLFVALSAPVQVEERKAQGTLTYILKNANIRVRNNTNALVTVHFNTPVTRARLVPHGRDLHFVIDLRAAATPAWKMAEGPDKSAVLQIDFPKGDFVAPPPKDEPAPEEKKPVGPTP